MIFLIPPEGRPQVDAGFLVQKMRAAYEELIDYKAKLKVGDYEADGSFEAKKLTYSFRKPNRIRLDFESPDKGAVLVYPDENGKAVVRPAGLFRFLKIRLGPSGSFLQVSPGQQITQTDLGLLIQNISKSVGEKRRGDLTVAPDSRHSVIRVVAEDHFREDVVTRYNFYIDSQMWLPVGVEQYTSSNSLVRSVFFHDLKVNVNLPQTFFQMD